MTPCLCIQKRALLQTLWSKLGLNLTADDGASEAIAAASCPAFVLSDVYGNNLNSGSFWRLPGLCAHFSWKWRQKKREALVCQEWWHWGCRTCLKEASCCTSLSNVRSDGVLLLVANQGRRVASPWACWCPCSAGITGICQVGGAVLSGGSVN